MTITPKVNPGQRCQVLNKSTKPNKWEAATVRHIQVLITESTTHYVYNVRLDRRTSTYSRSFPEGKEIHLNVTDSRIELEKN